MHRQDYSQALGVCQHMFIKLLVDIFLDALSSLILTRSFTYTCMSSLFIGIGGRKLVTFANLFKPLVASAGVGDCFWQKEK